MLVDTGVLLRAFDARFSEFRTIRKALRKSIDCKEHLFVSIQNIAEFWNVATRPLSKNGHGQSIAIVQHRVASIERLCEVVPENWLSYRQWKRIVEDLGVMGVAVHDARIASVMLAHGIDRVLTLNERDFRRYAGEGIAILTPRDYLNAPR